MKSGLTRRRTTACLIAAIAIAPVISPAAHGQIGNRPTLRWGAHVARRDPAISELDAVVQLENTVGRRFSASRVYATWAKPFPDRLEAALNADGRTLLFSMKPLRADGSKITWAQIAAAQPASQVYSQMQQLGKDFKAFGDPMYFIFHHEPEADVNKPYGSSAEFVAAWRKIVDIIRGQGASNVKFLWTMIDYSYTRVPPDRRAAESWYPGDGYVDALGVDAYNWDNCRGRAEGWQSLQQIIEPFRVFGARHPSKELWIPEYGTAEDPNNSGRKGQWLRDTATVFTQPGYEQFRGLAYFNDVDPSTPACNWPIDSSAQSVAGFAAAGAAPAFGGVVVGPPCVNVGISCGAIATVGAVRIKGRVSTV